MVSLLGNSRRPDISFYRDGHINITARVAKQLQLQAGDVIDIAYHLGEYYLYVRAKGEQLIGKHKAQCYPTKQGSHNFRCHSSKLCQSIMQISGATDAAKLPTGQYVVRNGCPAVILIVRNNLSDIETEIPIQ